MNPAAAHRAHAYRTSAYRAAGRTLRLMPRGTAMAVAAAMLAALGGARQGGFVSACNPRSRRRPEGWNRRMQAALAARLGRFRHLPASAGDGCWQEAHCLIAAAPARLGVLGRCFGQSAILVLAQGRAPRLLWLERV
ncbi:MAG: DUF3293 domain-containing protein [Rhodospirillales bacterium]|nr:DUF3293 domain-containing protein [Rhodospirillales bacterium]